MTKPAPKGELLSWLKRHVCTSQEIECLLWPYGTMHNGKYGSIKYDGRTMFASRVMLILKTGKNPDDLESAHICGNSICVNPHHLRWATRQENEHDKWAHGTSNRGERHGMSTLTECDVTVIVQMINDGASMKGIGDAFGVNGNTISRIKHGVRWQWFTGR